MASREASTEPEESEADGGGANGSGGGGWAVGEWPDGGNEKVNEDLEGDSGQCPNVGLEILTKPFDEF
jgi:hypothetical protein